MEILMSLATNDEVRQAISETTVKEQPSKRPLEKRCESIDHSKSKRKYDLMTKARWAVVGRNKQLDEGADRQTWKCLDLLNCAALVAFRKHGTWVQI